MGDINNQVITFRDLTQKKKYVYLDFWASWCKPCIKEFKNVSETNNFLNSKDVEYVIVNAHQSVFDEWKKNNQKLKIEKCKSYFAYDLTSFMAIMQTFDVSSIPKFVLIDAKGEVATFSAPRPSDPKFKKKITDLINAKKNSN